MRPQNFAVAPTAGREPGFAPTQPIPQPRATLRPPAPPVLPEIQFSRQPIRVQLTSTSAYGVNYMLNDWDYSMEPGQGQNFIEDREWVIRFDRGRGLGQVEYALEPGLYQFVREEATGWQLYQVPTRSPLAQSPPTQSPPTQTVPARSPQTLTPSGGPASVLPPLPGDDPFAP